MPSTPCLQQDPIRQRGSKIGGVFGINTAPIWVPPSFFRKSDMYSAQKNITDLMLEHCPASPLFTLAYIEILFNEYYYLNKVFLKILIIRHFCVTLNNRILTFVIKQVRKVK